MSIKKLQKRKVDETEKFYRFRQIAPKEKANYYTVKINNGIEFIFTYKDIRMPKAKKEIVIPKNEFIEEHKNLVKSKRRDLTIDAILEDKIDEWTDSETWGIDLDQEGYTRSISPQMKSLTVKSQKFIDNQTLYYDIVKKLES